MVSRKTLSNYCDQYLDVASFEDYCPNGLQVQGKSEIKTIVSGVSANQALIDCAIDQKADAIFVHHGFFWKNEKPNITGIKKNRIQALLANNINLFAYHLPLDAHPQIGNNIELAKRLDIQNIRQIDHTLLWQGETHSSLKDFIQKVEKTTSRKPLVIGEASAEFKTIAWCTGAAQNHIDIAIDAEVDAYLTGEVSEATPAIAKENNLVFISAGHHATERYGVEALAKHLSDKFGLKHQFIDIDNQV